MHPFNGNNKSRDHYILSAIVETWYRGMVIHSTLRIFIFWYVNSYWWIQPGIWADDQNRICDLGPNPPYFMRWPLQHSLFQTHIQMIVFFPKNHPFHVVCCYICKINFTNKYHPLTNGPKIVPTNPSIQEVSSCCCSVSCIKNCPQSSRIWFRNPCCPKNATF